MTPERLQWIDDYYRGGQWNGLSPQEHVGELVGEIKRLQEILNNIREGMLKEGLIFE